MSFIYNFTDTRWSSAGTTYNGIKLNLSNGAGGSAVGAAASRVFSLLNNSATIFDIDLIGNVVGASLTLNGNASSAPPALGLYKTASYNTMAVSGTSSGNTTAAFAVVDQTNPTKGLFFYVDTANSAFGIMAMTRGVNYQTLSLQAEGGNVGIGIGTATAASAILHVLGSVRFASFGAGAATFDASGNISSVSDERLKNIQSKFTLSLDKLSNIEPIVYKWNKESAMETEHNYVGFSAQNIRDNIPEISSANSKGMLSFQDRGLLAVLVNSVKELNAKVRVLENA